jgi:hypothetical protein
MLIALPSRMRSSKLTNVRIRGQLLATRRSTASTLDEMLNAGRGGSAARRAFKSINCRQLLIFVGLTLLFTAAAASSALAQQAASPYPQPTRPAIEFDRWQEDWSVLADPALRTERFDNLKYIRLSAHDPKSYVSLGINLRERVESIEEPSFGIAPPSTNYLLQRLEIHADVHPSASWQVFLQLEDDGAFGKAMLTAVDEDRLDLEQAFVAYRTDLFGGTLIARIGRQEVAFDLQRFVSARDGPNVRQAFDAVWMSWNRGVWRLTPFLSHPVQYANTRPFDDFSNRSLEYGGIRVERAKIGHGTLSAYYSRYNRDGARYSGVIGNERRNAFDVHYGGASKRLDWDLEAMGQNGSVGPKRVRAWGAGSVTGYTFARTVWKPRIGIQFDAASGNRHQGGTTLGTFNPLFPNGYYFTSGGYTGYSNVVHVKPSLTLAPGGKFSVSAALGLQWRETTADAVYVQGQVPVPNTAGNGEAWTGSYEQLRPAYSFSPNLTGYIEAVHYHVGETVRRAGGHSSDYVGVQLQFGW